MLSHGLWQRRLGGAEDVLGTRLELEGEAHTVVGVMPPGPGIYFLGYGDLWTLFGVEEAVALE